MTIIAAPAFLLAHLLLRCAPAESGIGWKPGPPALGASKTKLKLGLGSSAPQHLSPRSLAATCLQYDAVFGSIDMGCPAAQNKCYCDNETTSFCETLIFVVVYVGVGSELPADACYRQKRSHAHASLIRLISMPSRGWGLGQWLPSWSLAVGKDVMPVFGHTMTHTISQCNFLGHTRAKLLVVCVTPATPLGTRAPRHTPPPSHQNLEVSMQSFPEPLRAFEGISFWPR